MLQEEVEHNENYPPLSTLSFLPLAAWLSIGELNEQNIVVTETNSNKNYKVMDDNAI